MSTQRDSVVVSGHLRNSCCDNYYKNHCILWRHFNNTSISASQQFMPVFYSGQSRGGWLSSEKSQPFQHAKSDHRLCSDATPAWTVYNQWLGVNVITPPRLMCFPWNSQVFELIRGTKPVKTWWLISSRILCSLYLHLKLQHGEALCWDDLILPWSEPWFRIAMTSTMKWSQHFNVTFKINKSLIPEEKSDDIKQVKILV